MHLANPIVLADLGKLLPNLGVQSNKTLHCTGWPSDWVFGSLPYLQQSIDVLEETKKGAHPCTTKHFLSEPVQCSTLPQDCPQAFPKGLRSSLPKELRISPQPWPPVRICGDAERLEIFATALGQNTVYRESRTCREWYPTHCPGPLYSSCRWISWDAQCFV